MDIIYTSRDYGYNIEEFLSNLNENSEFKDNTPIEFLEKYVNNNIEKIHTYKKDFENQYKNCGDDEEEEIDKEWIDDTLSSLNLYTGPLIKEMKKWMKNVIKQEFDDIKQTIEYMYKSQEAYILYRFLNDIKDKEIITLNDVENVLKQDIELKNFLEQVEEQYKIFEKKEKEDRQKEYNKKLKIKNKNDDLILKNIMKNIEKTNPLDNLSCDDDEEILRVMKLLIEPLFEKLKSVTTIADALKLNDITFSGKLGRFLHSKMVEEETLNDAINIQLFIIVGIINHFVDGDYNKLYLNIKYDYYNHQYSREFKFVENEMTPLIDEVKHALKEYLISHKLFDIRGDFHNVKKDLKKITKEFTPLAIEIIHSALIHLFGTDNKNVKFRGDTKKVFSSFLNQIKDSDIKDASTTIRAIITDSKYGKYF
jgi:hypothetical protein